MQCSTKCSHEMQLRRAAVSSGLPALHMSLLCLSLLLFQLLLQPTVCLSSVSSVAAGPESPSACATSFDSALSALVVFATGRLQGTLRHRCPAQCLNGSLHNITGAVVLGRFPYHPSSSVCLSAIHAGVIDASVGGALWLSLFYSQSWDEQRVDIYPHGSGLGSYSHGVQSLPVQLQAPLTLANYSFVVQSRGAAFQMRRWAPWTARAGHLHVASDLFVTEAPRAQTRFGFHLIIGGRNATHYMNDVWMLSTVVHNLLPRRKTERWLRLPDAPFSPRADMAHSAFLHAGKKTSNVPRGACSWPGSRFCQLNVTVVGGQVGHHCRLPELGSCVAEAWQLVVRWDLTSLQFSVEWGEAAIPLPFAPRCGSLLMAIQQPLSSDQRDIAAVLGGQMSYADSSCQSPIVSSNEVWYSSALWSGLHWLQGADAPWSPRRSMLTRPDFAPANFVVMGGLRYLSFRPQSATEAAALTAAQLHADVFLCHVAVNASFGLACDWTPATGRVNVTMEDWGVAGSLPVPVARLPQAWTGGQGAEAWTGLMFSGASSLQAMQDWREREAASRGLMIEQPTQLGSLFPPTTLEDVMRSRGGLPLSYNLSAKELSDPSSPFNSGAPGLVLSFIKQFQSGQTASSPAFISAHELSSQQFGQSSPSLYSAAVKAEAVNTSRSALDFVYSRHSYGAAVSSSVLWYDAQTLLLSGGSSGPLFFNDVVEFSQLTMSYSPSQGLAGCFRPEDPAYAAVLGTGHSLLCSYDPARSIAVLDHDALLPLYQCDWQCDDNAHFEPPVSGAGDAVRIVCGADGLWRDASLLAFRSCVRNKVSCSFPLVDVGDACEAPQPYFTNITAAVSNAQGAAPRDGACTHVAALTVTDCPASELELELVGAWFTLPVLIWVGGFLCNFPQLRALDSTDVLCQQTADNQTECEQYGARVTCVVPMITGSNLPVVVLSGRNPRLAEARDFASPHRLSLDLPSLSYALPAIYSLSSPFCQQGSSALQLVGCPLNERFWIAINGSNLASTNALRNYTTVELGSMRTEKLQCLFLGGGWGPGYQQLQCTVPPGTGTSIPLIVTVRGLGSNSYQSVLPPDRRPSLSYSVCPAGSYTNYTADGRSGACVHCDGGFSTNGELGAQRCSPCTAGSFNNGTGHGVCDLCPPGHYSPAASPSCLNCSLNSYSLDAGVSVCDSCSLDQYVTYDVRDRSFVRCLPCLDAATCWPNGTISAQFGAFVLIDQATASISSASCHGLACLDGDSCLSSDAAASSGSYIDGVPRIPLSRLPVVNCCGPGRLPAPVNLLCAECLPQFAEWNGTCVPCSAVDMAALLLFAVLALLLLYCLHRFPSRLESGWLSMVMYYLQMALLFATHDTVPQLLSLVNLDLLGDFHTVASRSPPAAAAADDSSPAAWCIAPLSAWEKIGLHMLMPACALLGLSLLFVLQLSCLRLLFTGRQRSPRSRCSARLYRLFFTAIDDDIEKDRLLSSASLAPAAADSDSRSSAGVQPLNSAVRGARDASSKLLMADFEDDKAMADESEVIDDTESRPEPGAAVTAAPSRRAAMSGSGVQSLCGVSLLAYNRTLLRLVLYSYNNVSLAIVSFFHCQSLDAARGSRMYSYPTIDCQSQQYRTLLPAFVCGLVLVVLGIPLLLFAFLLSQRRRLRPPQQRDGSALSVADAESASKQYLAVQRVAYARYGLLYASYRADCWYWSCVVLLQRAVLILVFVFVPSPESFVWLSAINMCVLTNHLLVRPYRRQRDNRLETVLLFILCLQCMLFSLYPPSRLTNFIAVAISGLVLLPSTVLTVLLWAANTPQVKAAARRCCSHLRAGHLVAYADRFEPFLDHEQENAEL